MSVIITYCPKSIFIRLVNRFNLFAKTGVLTTVSHLDSNNFFQNNSLERNMKKMENKYIYVYIYIFLIKSFSILKPFLTF